MFRMNLTKVHQKWILLVILQAQVLFSPLRHINAFVKPENILLA